MKIRAAPSPRNSPPPARDTGGRGRASATRAGAAPAALAAAPAPPRVAPAQPAPHSRRARPSRAGAERTPRSGAPGALLPPPRDTAPGWVGTPRGAFACTPGRGVTLPLGTTTKFASPPPPRLARRGSSAGGDRRRWERFALREGLARFSTDPRVCACGRRRVVGGQAPEVRATEGAGGRRVAHFAGVQLCGKVWACPVCAPRIRHERARELDETLTRWVCGNGAGSVMLMTLTMPHDHGESLADLRVTVRESFRALTSGSQWDKARKRYGLAHCVVALDVTHGPNGWHPHLHVIVLGTRRLDDVELAAFRATTFGRWARKLLQLGRRAPSLAHGIDVERARSRRDVGRYVCQVIGERDDDARPWGVAQEAARTDLKRAHTKGHRTPWQILEDIVRRVAADGEWTAEDEAADERDRALWREWEGGMTGASSVRLGRGLRAAVGLGAEQSDEAIVAAEVGGEVVYAFEDAGEWLAVCDTRNGRARVLRAAERWGPAGCRRMVRAVVRRWQRRRAQIRGSRCLTVCCVT